VSHGFRHPLLCSLLIAFGVAACSTSPPEKSAAAALSVKDPASASNAAAAKTPATTAFSSDDAPLPPEKTGGFDAARAFALVGKQVAFGPRPPGSDAIRRTQAWLRGELDSYGCAVEEDNFTAQTPIGPLAMRNIVAKIPGTGASVVLLLTHYDTLRQDNFVGANDAGSSTAVMLEIARLLCGKKSAVNVWIALLDGEEAQVRWTDTDSVYGSRQLAAKLALSGDLKRLKAVLLADIVGGRGATFKRESNSTRWLADLVWSTARRLGYGRQFLEDETGGIQDDHLPFVNRGVSCVDLIASDYVGFPPWHTPQDTLDKISPRSLGMVGHVLVETLAGLQKKFG
jgi:Zn-dependent M28 family amino/carboxypeptidase